SHVSQTSVLQLFVRHGSQASSGVLAALFAPIFLAGPGSPAARPQAHHRSCSGVPIVQVPLPGPLGN
ncbi:hypothetical protein N5P37_005883, partial [Trichoderma harzianum]